jgi:uncharacterized protein YfaP (DUF2135 family)
MALMCVVRLHRVRVLTFTGPAAPASQHPHPAAPKESADAFGDFLRKFNSSASATSKKPSATSSGSSSGRALEFWETPDRLFMPRSRIIRDWEIEAVEVCVLLCSPINVCSWCAIPVRRRVDALDIVLLYRYNDI